MQTALVLEKKGELSLRKISLPDALGAGDVRIAIDTVGICGSDIHYYRHGKIGHFVVQQPMVLGHEASGVVTQVGQNVTHLKSGDRVCMEPGIPDLSSKASRLGIYNVDPDVKFWATPPVHGCLTPSVIHPAAFTFKLPETVTFAQGAMVEPFAIGMQAATRARIKPGDVALVTGAGPIGIMTALAALAGGCSCVFISDLSDQRLDIASGYENIRPLNAVRDNPARAILDATQGWGADIVFECAGVVNSIQTALDAVAPSGTVVYVGMPVDPVPIDLVQAQSKEVRMETVFRYANMYERAIALIGSGKVDLSALVSETFSFSESVKAFERAAEGRPNDVKIQIKVAQNT